MPGHRKPKKASPLIYLYGFTLAQAPRAAREAGSAGPLLPPSRGVEGNVGVDCVEHQGICALVSLVPAGVYEEQPLEEHFKDPCWLAIRVERHNRVLLEVLERAVVAPCRFGTLFRSLASVRALMARHRRLLKRVFRRLQDRAEWSVKAYVAPSLRQGDGKGCTNANTQGSGGHRGQGAAYLLGLVRERVAGREASQRVRDHAKRIIARLSLFAEDMVLLPLRNPEDGKGMIFLNLACLVRRSNDRAPLAALRKLADKEKDDLALSWSGPWPAYSFASGLFSSAVQPKSAVELGL